VVSDAILELVLVLVMWLLGKKIGPVVWSGGGFQKVC
jgi:hypothetical protein